MVHARAGFLPTRSERAPIPRVVMAFVKPKTEVTLPIWVKEVFIRISFANSEESPLWSPQTTPARVSTKRRQTAIMVIFSHFMRRFSPPVSALLNIETAIKCFLLLD